MSKLFDTLNVPEVLFSKTILKKMQMTKNHAKLPSMQRDELKPEYNICLHFESAPSGLLSGLTLNAPITTKVVCFSRLLKCLRSLLANSVDDQTAPIGAVCSGSTLFASILNSSVMLGNCMQHMTSADDIFRCIYFLGTLRVKHDCWQT